MKESCAYKHLWQIDGTKYNVSPPEGEDIFKIINLVLPKDFLAKAFTYWTKLLFSLFPCKTDRFWNHTKIRQSKSFGGNLQNEIRLHIRTLPFEQLKRKHLRIKFEFFTKQITFIFCKNSEFILNLNPCLFREFHKSSVFTHFHECCFVYQDSDILRCFLFSCSNGNVLIWSRISFCQAEGTDVCSRQYFSYR
jgi:hypothetical protein